MPFCACMTVINEVGQRQIQATANRRHIQSGISVAVKVSNKRQMDGRIMGAGEILVLWQGQSSNVSL